jgi:hypothetical protein
MGDHSDCRVAYDRALVPATCMLAEGCIAVRHGEGLLVPFIPAVQLACPGNHVVTPTSDGGRYLRDLLLHRDAEATRSPDSAPVSEDTYLNIF